MDIRDRESNIVFDVHIWDDDDYSWIWWWFENDFIEFLVISCFAFVRTMIGIIDRYVIIENVN